MGPPWTNSNVFECAERGMQNIYFYFVTMNTLRNVLVWFVSNVRKNRGVLSGFNA